MYFKKGLYIPSNSINLFFFGNFIVHFAFKKYLKKIIKFFTTNIKLFINFQLEKLISLDLKSLLSDSIINEKSNVEIRL